MTVKGYKQNQLKKISRKMHLAIYAADMISLLRALALMQRVFHESMIVEIIG